MVRDPRGMALSRMQLKPIPNNKPDKLTCLVMDNFKKEISDNPQWRAEIMFVRYEDLSIDPTNMAEKLHGFSGIDNYKEFEEWIYQQTHADEFIFDDDGGNGEEELNEENYLTIKQSERVAFKWIEDLSYYNTTKIQGYCKDVMKQFKGLWIFGLQSFFGHFWTHIVIFRTQISATPRPTYKIFNSEETYLEALDSFLDENKPATLDQLGCIDCVW